MYPGFKSEVTIPLLSTRKLSASYSSIVGFLYAPPILSDLFSLLRPAIRKQDSVLDLLPLYFS